MNRVLIPTLALACALGMGACVKSTSTTAINADNTGSVTLKTALKTEAIEQIRAMAEMQGGGEQVEEAMAEMDAMVDEAKLRAKLEKNGFKVTSIKTVDKDGWKTMELEASMPDVNEALAKSAKESEKKLADTPMAGMQLAGMSGVPLPRFYKSGTEGVGQAVIIPALGEALSEMGENPMDKLEDMDDETREMAEQQIEQMKAMFSVDEMKMEMTVKLPGKIVATKGCKQVDDHTVTFAMKGSDITIDGVKTMFGLKDGVSATFQIPEDCKITFLDAPKKAEKAPAKEEEEGGEEKSEKKKGGLKIGDENKD